MAKEVDLKKIELKVSVNCCDGCKKKVKKVLRSVEGVLKMEIDPSEPKVTILGNVEPQILIKKLLKIGKQAEIWSNEIQCTGKEKKEVEMAITKERENPKSDREKAKFTETSSPTADRIKESTDGGDGGSNIASRNDTKNVANSSGPEVTKAKNPLLPHHEATCATYPSMLHDMGSTMTHTQYCYMVEPCTITLPYYAIRSYTMPPLASTCYSQEPYYHERPTFQPLVQTPTAKVGDYFSDENTVGCHVM